MRRVDVEVLDAVAAERPQLRIGQSSHAAEGKCIDITVLLLTAEDVHQM